MLTTGSALHNARLKLGLEDASSVSHYSEVEPALDRRHEQEDMSPLELMDLGQRLDEKLSQQGTLLACYRSYLAPIRRLPVEILLEIFGAGRVLPGWTPLHAVQLVKAAEATCFHWHEIIKGTPDLHTWIALPQFCKGVPRQLRLSMGKLLRVYVSPSVPTFQLDETLQLLAKHGNRWEMFEVVNTSGRCDPIIPSLYDGFTDETFDSLTTLCIPDFHVYPISEWWIKMVFARAERLENVSLGDFRPSMGFPPASLRSLRVAEGSLLSLIDVLRRCDQLERLEVTKILDDVPAAANMILAREGPFVARNVRRLELGPALADWHSEECQCERLLTIITTPALQTLSCYASGSTLRDLYQRSAPPLGELQVSAYALCEDDILDALAVVPSLRTLRVAAHHWCPDVLIRALAVRGGSLILCPNLAHLEISVKGEGVQLICPDMFRHMIESRRAAADAGLIAPLKNVDLSPGGRILPDICRAQTAAAQFRYASHVP
ncbi:uncharacterized protein SCHCODRAFT_02745739 [Schizophyllum commune H4-8]|nr:uncharacterized protein SCHCODRAFT_02745739 [Schizophyllum commune H4-8]KAI5896841.1 hypothetical protein SCHCODRAFT_02745739 [Schizophyllum commune H4-8]